MAAAASAITPFPAGSAGTLGRACGSSRPGIACRLAWDLTHSLHAADVTTVYLAGPVKFVLRIALVLLVAVVLRLAAQRLITRLTSRVAQGQGGQAGSQPDLEAAEEESGSETGQGSKGAGRSRVFGERRGQRATALATLLGNAATVTIFSVAAVIILGDMGVNLAPVLASAGVLGIAIGFGAQNLVKDFLAGIFMLLEDQYGVGDVIDVGGVAGTVEAVSLRITRLRDIHGVVWHIRNGTIKRAGNETHGWARAVIDFPVPYQVPVPAARGVMEQAAVALWQEPGWRDVILDRPEVWGVENVLADTVLIRVTARTVPQGKLEVARELRERLKGALDAEASEATGASALPAGQAGGAPEQAGGPPEA